MNNNDIRTREELRQALQQAAVSGDTGAFSSVLDEMMQRIGLDIQAEYEQRFDDLRQEVDSRILAQRGVHQLTSEERSYYPVSCKYHMNLMGVPMGLYSRTRDLNGMSKADRVEMEDLLRMEKLVREQFGC